MVLRLPVQFLHQYSRCLREPPAAAARKSGKGGHKGKDGGGKRKSPDGGRGGAKRPRMKPHVAGE